MGIRSIIVDDEELARNSLNLLLKEYVPDVNILCEANSAIKGAAVINGFQPELVFLDIEMSGGDGFEMLDALDKINFDVIFVTAHEEFALKAFKYEALDFLLKPVNPEELIKAVNKYKKRITVTQKLDHRMNLVKSMSIMNSKVPLPYQDGVRFLEIGKVIRLEADGSYTTIFSTDERPQVVSKPLKFYATLLSDEVFIRVHRSHLVNIRFVKEFKREGNGSVLLDNGDIINVAEKKREHVLRRLSS